MAVEFYSITNRVIKLNNERFTLPVVNINANFDSSSAYVGQPIGTSFMASIITTGSNINPLTANENYPFNGNLAVGYKKLTSPFSHGLTYNDSFPDGFRTNFNSGYYSIILFHYNDKNVVSLMAGIGASSGDTLQANVIDPVTSEHFGLMEVHNDYWAYTWSVPQTAAAQSMGEILYNNSTPPPTDPYADAGDSTTGGGDGTFDGSSDPVPIPNLPTVGATDSGFITLFAPTTTQLKALAYYMWVNPLFDVETGFKKIFSDPMDCILGLSVVPVSVPTSGVQNVTVGNLVTSVTMNVASQQYIEVDCGSIDFTRQFFGSYLDFEPYTKMSLFVPYSGVHSVNADDIIGKIVTLKYHIDILTGSLVAFLLCGDSVLYEFNGACASNIPVNSMNYASTIENSIRIAVNIGTTVATAGAAAPATTAAAATTQAMKNTAAGVNLVGSTAEGALSLKPNIDRAGSLGGTTGIMGNQTPYFIITRPRLCKPKNQNFYKGYPSFIQCVIGDLEGKGYTEFDTVILSNTYLTDSEKDELIGILKGGVYL